MISRRARRIVVLSVALLLGATGYWYFGTSHVPAGQPVLATVSVGSLESLRADFNRAAGDTRIIMLLSPT